MVVENCCLLTCKPTRLTRTRLTGVDRTARLIDIPEELEAFKQRADGVVAHLPWEELEKLVFQKADRCLPQELEIRRCGDGVT